MGNHSKNLICTLYEFGEWGTSKDCDSLRLLTRSIWQDRKLPFDNEEPSDDAKSTSYQPFLNFDGNKIRAKNYVGFIQNGDEVIEIYPKVFRNDLGIGKQLMLSHVFYWISYCTKWRFPFSKVTLDDLQVESFPELIIYLMARQIFESLSEHVIHQYQPVQEAMTTPRGRINFHRYLNNSLPRGNHHFLECDHEPFSYDNQVNRVIKYCSRLLLSQTQLSESQRLLQEILFILDEVEDVPCTSQDVDRITLNSFFEDYQLILEICKSILGQRLYWNSSHSVLQWSLLFPMEYVFEDFIAGFLRTHFSHEWTVEYQKSDKYLTDTPVAFNLQHDILLTKGNRKIIVDAKYKLRDQDFKADKKKGVQQADLYQVLSYATKRGCTEAILIYPNINQDPKPLDEFEINSGFPSVPTINVKVFEIPFWSTDKFPWLEESLKRCFNSVLAP